MATAGDRKMQESLKGEEKLWEEQRSVCSPYSKAMIVYKNNIIKTLWKMMS